MEVFSLLKFWRNAGATDSSVGDAFSEADFSTESSCCLSNQIEEDFDDDDEDSFFDLVFTSPKRTKCSTAANDDLRTKSDGDSKSNFMESPTDVFFNKSNSSPISFLKSSPKLRVFTLGFKKPKLVKSQVSCASMATTAPDQPIHSSKRFTVDCQIKEVPIASLLTRDNSLRAKLRTERLDESKRFRKDVSNYLNLIKPLYVKASKRYTDKSSLSGKSPNVTPSSSPATVPAFSPTNRVEEKQPRRTTVFRNVSKHLGKSRSESRFMAGKVNPSPSSRSDDSLVHEQDGIQGAILHCKRYYSSSAYGNAVLKRSESSPGQVKSMSLVFEEKRISI